MNQIQTGGYCTNCGEGGHTSKQCQQPITSFGAIILRFRTKFRQAETLLTSETAVSGLTTPEFLLIQRRDSLGYIDIMRGKYKLTDTEYITLQVRGMTTAEQEKLLTEPFDSLWQNLWGPPTEGSNSYKHEKEQSRLKLDALRSGAGCTSLAEIIETIGKKGWDTPEWGFPKGRRDLHETEYGCAIRELWEETGVEEREIIPIRNLEPIREVFFGSNHIQYCHKYFLFYMPSGKNIQFDPSNPHMQREIGDLRWCSAEEALTLIRPENVEKREVVLRVSRLLRNYCPLLTAPQSSEDFPPSQQNGGPH